MTKKPYPSAVTNDERVFVASYRTLLKENAPQQEHALREAFNSLRWIAARVLDDVVLRALLRLAKGKRGIT